MQFFESFQESKGAITTRPVLIDCFDIKRLTFFVIHSYIELPWPVITYHQVYVSLIFVNTVFYVYPYDFFSFSYVMPNPSSA